MAITTNITKYLNIYTNTSMDIFRMCVGYFAKGWILQFMVAENFSQNNVSMI